jgi:hypothetical protein
MQLDAEICRQMSGSGANLANPLANRKAAFHRCLYVLAGKHCSTLDRGQEERPANALGGAFG